MIFLLQVLAVTPFMANVTFCRYLASKGANLNAACWSGTTALMHASQRGYLDIVKVRTLFPRTSDQILSKMVTTLTVLVCRHLRAESRSTSSCTARGSTSRRR